MHRDKLLESATREARRFRHPYIRSEHLLLAIVPETPLERFVDYAQLAENVRALPRPTCAADDKLILAKVAERALIHAQKLAGDEKLTASHVLQALIHTSPIVRNILRQADVKLEDLQATLEQEHAK